MRKFTVGLFITTVTLVLMGVFFQRHALACELLPVLDYQQIGSAVFVDAGISEEQAATVKAHIDSASERIDFIYGTPESTPRILITSSSQMAANWGANDTASMHRMPWRSCIVIGPKGQNVDVIAHEWLHAETQHRVGFPRLLMKVPTWFDEGVALTLDYREPYLPENISLSADEIQTVRTLVSGRAFFSGDIRKNYQAARLAVEPLIVAETFYDELERVALGDSFESVFIGGL
ncbi:MAG: hypothetical protein AB8B57_16890 [Congregibacter sp.]